MSDLNTFARKLMRIKQRSVAANTPSAIFGSVGELPQAISSRPPLRIGLWSCLSEEKPELAMGLWVALAHLLERWQDIEVYRLFVAFEEEPEDFVWTIEKSQFSVEDWDLPSLDENIGIWGELKQSDGQWRLTTTIDNDNLTGQDNEATDIDITAATAIELFGKLPALAEQIAEMIEADRLTYTDPTYSMDLQLQETPKFTDFVGKLLDWEVNLLAFLWGVDFDDDDIAYEFSSLLSAAKATNNELVAWLLSKSLAQSMRPGYSVIGDAIVEKISEIEGVFDSSLPMPILADAAFNLGYAQRAYRLMENNLKNQEKSANAWLKLAEMYAYGGLIPESIDRFQTAIEKEAVNNHLYRSYGNILLTAYQQDRPINSYILIDLNEYEQNRELWESVEAYAEALKLEPSDIRARYAKLLQLAEIDYDEQYLWDDFVKLVEVDETGEYVRDVIDSFYDLPDVSRGVEILEKLIKENPERLDLLVNLGSLYLATDNNQAALAYLEKAKSMATINAQIIDIERLMLSADNPEFEYRFGEIKSILAAGRALNSDDVEFLEDVVEQAPLLVDARVALGTSYYLWEENDEALEVFLDAQEAMPDQPIIIDWLARILWESGERATAFTYLNRGISVFPFNVQLIARAGQYLFDNEQLDEARAYLARAEEISPRHPTLQAVRTYVARQMANNPEKYRSN